MAEMIPIIGAVIPPIVDLLIEFDTETLTTVFPEYYKEIKPPLHLSSK